MAKLSTYERFIRNVAVPIMQSCHSFKLHNLIAGHSDMTTPISAKQMNNLLNKIRMDIEDFDNSDLGFYHCHQADGLLQIIGSSIRRELNPTVVVLCDDNYNKNRIISKILRWLGYDCVLEGDKIHYEEFTFIFITSFDELNLKEVTVDYFLIYKSNDSEDLDKIKESITEYGKTHTVKTIIYEV